MITAQRLLEFIGERTVGVEQLLWVFWHVVESQTRATFAHHVETERARRFIVPLIPRGGTFKDPDAVGSDLSKLIQENEGAFGQAESISDSRTIVIVLLSHRALEAPPVSSLLALPLWFPKLGGREVSVRVEDITSVVPLASMNGPETRVQDLARALFRLELLVTKRLLHEMRRQSGACQALAVMISLEGRCDEFLAGCEKYLDGFEEHGYRINVGRSPRSVLGRLVQLTARSTPDQLAAFGITLSQALAADDSFIRERSILSILYKGLGVKGVTPPGHELLVAVFGAYHLMNGAAHAGEYPRFPANLLIHVSRDVLRILHGWIHALSDPL